MRLIDARPVTDSVCHHGEGPVWIDGALWWVDMLAGDVLRLDADAQITRHRVGEVAAVVRPRRSGGLVIASEREFLLFGDGAFGAGGRSTIEERLTTPVPDHVRLNEGGVDPSGRFWCGSMAYDGATGEGRLYRVEHDRSVTTVLDGVTISNGLDWSGDGRTAFYVDSPTRRIDCFDFDTTTGGLTNRRPFVEFVPGVGNPDGLTLDADGGVWVALWDGGAVHRYDTDGVLDHVVELPTRRVTACTFGGPDLDTLYITTSRLDLDDPEPWAGAVGRPVRAANL